LGKRLHTTILSLSGESYDLEFFDDNYSGASTEVKTVAGSVSIRWVGADKDRTNPIVAASLSVGLVVENATIESFVTDLITAPESRFQVVLKKSSTVKFAGYIVTDLVAIENISYPYTFTISATDGIGRLKDLDYNNAGTAYSGKETVADHIDNIIGQIGLSAHTGTTLTKLTSWQEDTQQPAADLLANTRVDHAIFTKQDRNGNDQFSNPFRVLKELCKIFLARFLFWDGSYHFQQINQYATYSGADVTATKAVSTGLWTFLPPFRQVRIILKYGEQINSAKGIGLTQDNNTGVISGDFNTNDTFVFKGLLEYKTTFSTAFIAANGVKVHRVKIGIVIGIGDRYLERSATTADFYNIENGEMEWVQDGFNNLHYYEIYGTVITEFNYNFNKIISFNIETPSYPGADVSTARLQIHTIHFLKPDGGYYTAPDIDISWTLYNAHFQKANEETTVRNYEKIYTASNSIAGNSKNKVIETVLGDVDITTSPAKLQINNGTTWEDSDGWTNDIFTSRKLGQLLANEVMAAQTTPVRVLEQTLILSDFSPLSRVTYQGVQYMFLSGTWLPERDEIAGQFAEINIDRANVTEGAIQTGDGSTTTDPTNPDGDADTGGTDPTNNDNTDPSLTNIQISILDCISLLRLDQDVTAGTNYTSVTIEPVPTNTIFYENDILKVIHPVTGYVETVTVLANTGAADEHKYIAGDTTLYLSWTPNKNIPDGAYILKDFKTSPKVDQSYQYRVFSNQTAFFIDVNFNLPTDIDEVHKRLQVVREYATAIYNKGFTIGPDGGGLNRRITFNIPLSNENVIVRLWPEI
jgi:hypothetical protein